MDYLQLLRSIAYVLSTWSVEHPTWALYEGGAPADPTAEAAEVHKITFANGQITFKVHGKQPNEFPSVLVYHRQDAQPTPNSSTAFRAIQLEIQLTTKTSNSRSEQIEEYENARTNIRKLVNALRSMPAGYRSFQIPGAQDMIFLRILGQGAQNACGAQCVVTLQLTR
jgi:hypothetical protein